MQHTPWTGINKQTNLPHRDTVSAFPFPLPLPSLPRLPLQLFFGHFLSYNLQQAAKFRTLLWKKGSAATRDVFPDNAVAPDDDDEDGDEQNKSREKCREQTKTWAKCSWQLNTYVWYVSVRYSVRAKAERSVNYPASKYLMRFAIEKAHRRGKGQGNEERKRRMRERERERHNNNNNIRGIRSSVTKTNREK